MNVVTFAHPAYLHLYWLLPVLVLVRLWAARSSMSAADTLVAKRLRSLLIASASPVIAWLVFALQLVSLGFFAITLAQPRWGDERRQITESGKNVLLAIDTSKSMLADDVKPNRLLRAKLAAQDLVEELKEHRVGLIAFAGRPYLQAPLTTDHAAVVESLQALDTFTIPMGGTSISSALREAMEVFAKTKARSHGLVLISDGGEADSALPALLAKAKEKRVIIITIGVGTEVGGTIPDPDPDRQGDYLRDPATGTPVHTKLEEDTLKNIAASTDGRYLRLGEKGLDNALLLQTLRNLETMQTGNREEVKPIERFYWPLSVGILCLMLSVLIRPSARLPRLSPAAVGLMLLLCAQAADASVLSLGQTIEEARSAYKEGNFTRSRDLYSRLLSEDTSAARSEEYAYGLGASAHQLKDYDRAVEGFSRALRTRNTDTQARAHQSLGNALYEQGAKALQQQPEFTIKAWVDSLSHYDAALAIHDDKAVRENFEFVRKKLEIVKQQEAEKKKQQQEKRDQGEKDKEKGGKGEKKEGDPSEGEEGEESEKGDKPGEQKEGKGDEKKDKQGKGEEQEAKEGEQIPEGQIKAGEGGDKPDQKQRQAMTEEMAEQQPDDRTGFSRNEARSLLRAYSDQMQLLFQQRQREKAVKRDW